MENEPFKFFLGLLNIDHKYSVVLRYYNDWLCGLCEEIEEYRRQGEALINGIRISS